MNMKIRIQPSEPTKTSNFDSLCQGFESGNFYGLEYILDDFFQGEEGNASANHATEIDWFGLYQ